MNNTNINQNQRPRKDVSGVNNPFYGHKHSQESKNKMSQAATERNKQYQKWKDSQHHITMDEFLSANPQLDIKGYLKSLMKEEFLTEIIRAEIKKLL